MKNAWVVGLSFLLVFSIFGESQLLSDTLQNNTPGKVIDALTDDSNKTKDKDTSLDDVQSPEKVVNEFTSEDSNSVKDDTKKDKTTIKNKSGKSGDYFTVETDNYMIYSEISKESAEYTGKAMQALFKLYNSYFRFNVSKIPAKLRVRILADSASFEKYLKKNMIDERTDFVYVHYNNPNKREMVGYNMESKDFDRSLAHQGFIQFIKTFIPNPPIWFREGFAIYFELCSYNAEKDAAEYIENTEWLETVKGMTKNQTLTPLQTLLTLTPAKYKKSIATIYPQIWALVSFIMNAADPSYNRIFIDAIHAMKSDASMADNSNYLKDNVFNWYTDSEFQTKWNTYLSSKKILQDYIDDGISLYSANKFAEAEASFNEALKLSENLYAAYYYLGLIYYAKQDYIKAAGYYEAAQKNGAPVAIVNYALGINAHASGNLEQAMTYLNQAKSDDPEKYSEKVDTIIQQIKESE